MLFVLLFAFFRLAYNVGLGWILIKQSKSKYIVNEVLKHGWLDANKRPKVAAWCKRELEGKIGRGTYTFEDTPKEFTIWLLFRQVRPTSGPLFLLLGALGLTGSVTPFDRWSM